MDSSLKWVFWRSSVCKYLGIPFLALLGRNFELFEAIAHVTQRPGPTASATAQSTERGGRFLLRSSMKMKAISCEKLQRFF